MTNYYNKVSIPKTINPQYGKTHMFQVPLRMVISGGSGSGKTNTVLDIIARMDKTFNKIILCVKDRHEPLYDLLKKKLKDQLIVFDGDIPVPGTKKGMQPNVPPLNDLNTDGDDEAILVIFDDLCLDGNQDRIGQYFIRGRKKNVSSIYITQSYFKCPKTIRLQCQYFLFKANANKRDLACILRESMLEESINELMSMYRRATQSFEDFLFIDNSSGKCYKTFSTSPMSAKQEPVSIEPLSELQKKARGPVKYDKLAGEKQSAKDYVEGLKQSTVIQGLFPVRHLYHDYQQWCRANDYEIATKNTFGTNLKPHFKRRKLGDGIGYYINVEE